MINETLRKIQERIDNSRSLSPEGKKELLELMGKLEAEVTTLSERDADHAQSIANFIHASTHEATRADRRPQSLKHAVDGLSSSVTGFEKAHPKLVETVNRISVMLSNMGI